MSRRETIRNPIPLDNVRSYEIQTTDGLKFLSGVGAANAYYMAKMFWPNIEILTVKEI